MFYLKHRPQTLEELDNEAIREKLKIIFKAKRVVHALLFTGQKGTGKTSAARLIAKILNCLDNSFSNKSSSFEPCNHCSNCLSITSGSSIDVIEMDAASNRKIDDIRDLISKIKFAPTYCRFKIYIIDEVHMLTTESFNALLKTLEEPPKSTVFILATTEVEKLPETIISRCLKFNFGKAKENEILRMLKRIITKEKLNIDEEVIKFIAKHSDNSFRDATKLLEELAYSDKDFTIDNVKKIIGLNSQDNDLLKIIEDKDLKEVLVFIENFEKQGGNFKTLIEFTLNRLHLLILKKNRLETDFEEDYNFSLKEIAHLIRLFQEALNSLKFSPIEALPLEIAIIDFLNREVRKDV